MQLSPLVSDPSLQPEFEATLQDLLGADKKLRSQHRLSLKRGTETNAVYGEQRLDVQRLIVGNPNNFVAGQAEYPYSRVVLLL